MSKTEPQLESLIHSLKHGTPRAAYRARQELIGFGRTAEVALIPLLREMKESSRILDVLAVLQEVKLSDTTSVDAVVRLLSHKEVLIRRAVAHCLLIGSPKLRRSLAQIRAAQASEKDGRVAETLKKLLDRYPGGAD